MSDEELNSTDDDFDAAEDDGKGGKKKMLLFILIPLLVLIGAGVGLYMTGMLDGLLGKGDTHASDDAEAGHDDGHGGDDSHASDDGHSDDGHGDGHGEVNFQAAFLPIPDIVVNLKTKGSQQRFLRLRVQLELEDATQKASVEQVMPRVVDQFQVFLREMRVEDLQGSAGIYRLQKELIARVNAAAYPVEVKDVLFQEMLIQ